MAKSVQSVIVNSEFLDPDDVAVSERDINTGSHWYATISTEESSYFLKTYDESLTEAHAFDRRKEILKAIDQERPTTWQWGTPEHEYRTMKQLYDQLPDSSGTNVVVPQPIELIGSDTILMERLPRSSPMLLNWDLLRGMHLLGRRDRIAQTKAVARSLARFHEQTLTDEPLDVETYVQAHRSLAAESSLPAEVRRFLDAGDFSSHASLPSVRIHGDFTPRNILCLDKDQVCFIDFPLSVVSHPMIDTHEFLCHLLRWETYPGTASGHIRKLRRTFRDTYGLASSFEFSAQDYRFTRLTALVRYFWMFVDRTTGKKGAINRAVTRPRLESELTDVMQAYEEQ